METQNGQQIVLRNPEAIYELCNRLGLMWVVEKQPLFLADNKKTDYFGVVRKDTQKVFAVSKDSYEIFQNWELAEIVSRIAEARGQTIERGGMLDEGAKVYIQFAMPDFKVNGDIVRRLATGLGSFDLSMSLKWGEQSTIIVCRNTFMKAYNTLKTSVRHTKNMRLIVEQSLRSLEYIEEEDKALLTLFNQMLDTPATEHHIRKIVEVATNVDLNKSQNQLLKEYSTRKLNVVDDILGSLATEMDSKGKTLWGAWNGLTHYTTHLARGTEEGREKSKLIGSLQRIDESVLNEMKRLIQQGTGILVN
jgi:phage/plasmid-like protein (TIGR03299 family)